MWNGLQVPQRETVVRATGARRMRRRPAAGASTSSARAAAVEGPWLSVLYKLFFVSSLHYDYCGFCMHLRVKFPKFRLDSFRVECCVSG